MSYCAICGNQHDPDVSCFDVSEQALRDMGANGRSATPNSKFGDYAKQADWWILKLLLSIVGLTALVAAVVSLLKHW
jgi:hypothetical protein